MSEGQTSLDEGATSPARHRRKRSRLLLLPDPLAVTVVFTTVAATLEALREAGRTRAQLRARIRILVPSVVPYPLDLDRPRVDPLFRLRHFRTLCDQHSVETVRRCSALPGSPGAVFATLSRHTLSC